MLFDEVRNSAYAKAIREAVTPDTVVLDLGCGLGLLGLIAAQAGARHVYMVDPAPVLQMARKVALANGLAGRMSFIQSTIEEAQLPEPVDLITSVMTGNFLLGEDLLPSLFAARDRYLKPGGQLIPARAEMRMAPAEFDEMYQRVVAAWTEPMQGMDFGLLKQMASNRVIAGRLDEGEYRFLALPITVNSVEFRTATRVDLNSLLEFELQHSGTLQGYIGWFRAQLGDEWLSTGPHHPATHWAQALLPLDPPLEVLEGTSLEVRLQRPQNGEWSWLTRYAGQQRKNSEFFSRQLTPQRLALADENLRPVLSRGGELVVRVLQAAAAGDTLGEIRSAAWEEFNSMFADQDSFETEIARIVADHSIL